MEIEKKVIVSVNIDAFELADIFWKMNSEEKATFFTMIGKKKIYDLAMQLEYISQEDSLNLDGRNFMQQIGEYSWHNSNREQTNGN